MRIAPVANFNINFKSQEKGKSDAVIFGYDDEESRNLRKRVIRDSLEQKISAQEAWVQYNDYRIGEYKLNKLINFLLGHSKKVSEHKMQGIGNFVAPNFYTGRTLYNQPQRLEKLKEAGIERVIDLYGYQVYEENCKKAGLEYCALFQGGIWQENNAAGKSKEEYLASERQRYKDYGHSKEDIDHLLKSGAKNFDVSSEAFIEELITLVNTINKGCVYMGCECGTHQTTDALFLNELFNPKFCEADISYFPESSNEETDSAEMDLKFATNLYNKLTPEHKARMGWSEEFDENLKAKLEYRKEELEELYGVQDDDDDQYYETDED